jgi:hypothetical protein
MRDLRQFLPLWSSQQRGVLIAFVFILIAVLGVRRYRNPQHITEPQPEKGARFDELADKVDPNQADWQTLAALPQLGEKRAKAIVDFREDYRAKHSGAIAFKEPLDLTQIRGIGTTTVETLQPYLMFPATQPTTRR